MGVNSYMFHVKKMKVDDFSFAVHLANKMNWNMTKEDFEFMLKLEPQGCLVLLHNQEPSGIATSISFGKLGWFGNLIIKEEFRGKSAGSVLVAHAMDYLKNKGVETIGIYAYPHLVKFYWSLGFKCDIDFLVLKGKVTFHLTHEMLRKANSKDAPAITNFDCQCFGANRKRLLEVILLNKYNLCYISTENNEITGYVATKVHNKTVEVGPLVCRADREKAAELLLKTMLSRLNGFEVFMYIPKKEASLLNILHKAGLKEDFRVVRMFSGPAVVKNCIYAAESLERG
jgi:ribosomal protein S18 acetylase RimI-like enzyme